MTTDFIKSSQINAFDYVIVGGGTAGCVIASRLSEYLPEKKILLVEAGPSDFNDDRVLKLKDWLTLLGGELDYDYGTTEQPNGSFYYEILGQHLIIYRKLTYQTFSGQSSWWMLLAQHPYILPTL